MTKTTEFQSGVMTLLNLMRNYNPNIGAYKEHYLSERSFTVLLSNGKIYVSRECARDIPSLPDEATLEYMANTFQTL